MILRWQVYDTMMSIGALSGCHQMQERSFTLHSRQFPVCARCTGVGVGNVMALILLFVWQPPSWLLVAGCGVMFVDWLVQHLGLHESSNWRRLITGMFGGFSLTSLCLAPVVALMSSVGR